MEARVHPTAVVHPTAIIGPNVTLEENVYVGAYSVIGTCAEHSSADPRTSTPGPVHVKAWTTIREHVTIHGGAEGRTVIGERCHIQAHAHIGHDARLDDDVTVACYACVGGHTVIGKHANLGLHSVVHQKSKFPPGSFLGMNSSYKGDDGVPYTVYVGNLAQPKGANWRLMEKHLAWMVGYDV